MVLGFVRLRFAGTNAAHTMFRSGSMPSPSFRIPLRNKGPQEPWSRSFCRCPGCGPRGHHGGWKHHTQTIPRSILRGNRPHQRFLISTVAVLQPAWNSSLTWRDHRQRLLLTLQICDSTPKACSIRMFSTSRRNDFPLPLWCIPGWPVLAGFLKSSGMLSFIQMIARVALTVFPAAVLKKKLIKEFLEHLPPSEHPTLAPIHNHLSAKMPRINRQVTSLLLLPVVLVGVVLLASLERTPLTGRWRTILLSPEEEEKVAADLVGDGWYNSIANVLTNNHPEGIPRVVPLNDWRTQWVLDTLRRLEAVVPLLQETSTIPIPKGDIPIPPPLHFPLLPRPRVSTVLHHIQPDSDSEHHATHDPPSHTLLGPPYSLLVLEDPKMQNAFAYGFGPHGGGGVVVYTGFVDEILRRHPSPMQEVASQKTPSLWSRLTNGPTSLPPPKTFVPTPEQTTELAILLAHEMSHLILSHHLETLSTGSIVIPAVVSILTDVARTILFPITMMFGPFLNDALLEVSKISVGEITNSSDACRNRHLEVEADLVSARLLAYAGFDPRAAVSFWEARAEAETCTGKHEKKAQPEKPHWFSALSKMDDHPISEIRIDKLKKELLAWETKQRQSKKKLESKSAKP